MRTSCAISKRTSRIPAPQSGNCWCIRGSIGGRRRNDAPVSSSLLWPSPSAHSLLALHVGRPFPSALSGGAAGAIDNQRGSQIRCVRRLIPVQPELREVIVHVRDGARRRLLRFLRSGPLLDLSGFLFCVELLRDVLGPLQWRICVVCPKALQIWLPVGCARRSSLPCLPGQERRDTQHEHD